MSLTDNCQTSSFAKIPSVENWLQSRYKIKATHKPWSNKRYAACHILKEGGIPCILWSEDALGYYGVDTVLFNTYIMVDNVENAMKLLRKNGWQTPPKDFQAPYTDIKEATKYLIDPMCQNSRRFPGFDPAVALLAASDWNVPMPDISSYEYSEPQELCRWPFIPPLHQLLDSLIDKWLDSSDQDFHFRMHISVFLEYLYHDVPVLRQREFACYLKAEHQQYHYDMISGRSILGVEFRKSQKKIRDLIRKGDKLPQVS